MARALVLMLLLLVLGGCSTYQFAGTVVSGSQPGVLVVDRDDPRLARDGVPGARVKLTVDPASMSPKEAGTTVTDESGRFSLDVSELGAGFLEYEAGVLTRAAEHQTLWQTLPLPEADKRLLIVLAPGRDTWKPEPDILEETLEVGRRLSNQ